MNTMSNEELLGYAELHCKTERALFHADHVNRIIALAGYPDWCVREVSGWVSAHEQMQELVDLARARISSTLAQQVASAKAETATWPEGKLARVKLAGGDQP